MLVQEGVIVVLVQVVLAVAAVVPVLLVKRVQPIPVVTLMVVEEDWEEQHS